jgi:AcrR family transcriptional regulator
MAGERGRPRGFDVDDTLDRALEVFWRHGFQGTSLSELTEATGLSKPSLYAAFGDKEALYLKALDRYTDRWSARYAAVLEEEPDARRAIEQFLRTVVAVLTDPALPGGCFVVTGSADCGVTGVPDAVDAALRKSLHNTEMLLHERLKRAQRDGQLAPDAATGDLATLFSGLVAGFAVKARSGARRTRLNAAIDAAMRAWPEPPLSTATNARPKHKEST